MEKAKVVGSYSVTEQRIVLSTLAYNVHDLMADHVKTFKQRLETATVSQPELADHPNTATFHDRKSTCCGMEGLHCIP